MSLSLFLARRIYGGDYAGSKVSRPAVRIATAGVAIGLAVMIVSVCVVLGFKHTIRDKVTGFGSHITVGNYMTVKGGATYPACIEDSMMNVLRNIEGVKHVERYALTQGILKTDSDFLGVVLKGVAPEYDMSFFEDNLRDGSIPDFSKLHGKNIVISGVIADKLKLKAGDKVFAYFVNRDGVRARRFTISGIYDTNLSKYDRVFCFTDMQSVVNINGWYDDLCTAAQLTTYDLSKVDEVENRVVDKINRTVDKYGGNFSSQTVREGNSQIFAWLDLLDINVWIILILMVAVAGFTMISGLLIIILERTTMIGILKSVGARNGLIRRIFLWFAVFVIGKGMIIGNVIALALILIQKFTGVITLDPATYYVREVPVEFNIPLILLLNVATLIVCVLALIAPSYFILTIRPAKAIQVNE